VERRSARVGRRAVLHREHECDGLEGVRRAQKMREVNGPMNNAPTVHSLVGQREWVGPDDSARAQGSVGEGERRKWRFEETLYLGR
jgi:hypothetical protein